MRNTDLRDILEMTIRRTLKDSDALKDQNDGHTPLITNVKAIEKELVNQGFTIDRIDVIGNEARYEISKKGETFLVMFQPENVKHSANHRERIEAIRKFIQVSNYNEIIYSTEAIYQYIPKITEAGFKVSCFSEGLNQIIRIFWNGESLIDIEVDYLGISYVPFKTDSEKIDKDDKFEVLVF